ncbi:MAG: aspartate/glutamate racemase family protein [Gammaproteobacteria bacterium]|nr:aspartate/glutamate racemase family protein [Gammaproteobacteria bacterium]
MKSSCTKKCIGILGGMGPEATVLLMTQIIKLTPARDDSDHVPLIIDNNTQVPSRIQALIENSGADPGPVLQQMAIKLELNGAQALAMPCNTAHYYAGLIQDAVQIPFLNMIELCAILVSSYRLKNKTVGVLGSPAVRRLGLFDDVFSRQAIDVIYPQNQPLMLKAIRAIKSDSRDNEARWIFKQACQELSDKGADILLVGCSEFSIISDAIPETLRYIDTIDVLAQTVVDFASGNKICETAHSQPA